MKKLFISILVSCAALFACTQEKIIGPNSGDIPKASDYKAVVDVNQTTNIASFSITMADGSAAKAVYPVWEVKVGKKTLKGTGNGFKTTKIIFNGDYEYTVKIANRNGVSDASLSGTFHIDNLGYDFKDIASSLVGAGEKEWRVYSIDPGHLGCGENQANPTGWWAAGPNEKADNGIYDDRIIFKKGENSATGTYIYNPGEDGLTFCNKGVSKLGRDADPDNDYDVAAVDSPNAKKEVAYDLGIIEEGEIPTITLPAGTLIPYMADDSQVNNATTYVITELKDKFMTWVINLPGISWQIKFINGDDPEPEAIPEPSWVDVNGPNNLWHTAKLEEPTFYYADAGWAPYGTNPTITKLEDGKSWTINYPLPTYSRWQNQFTILTNIPATMQDIFDIRVTIVSNKGGFSAMAKLVQPDESEAVKHDNNFICAKEQAIEKGENIIWVSGCSLEQNDTETLQFVFDFGGNPEDTEITIKDIIIQKQEPEPAWVAVDSDDNLWWKANIDPTPETYYAAGDDWHSLGNPDVTDNGDGTWTMEYPYASNQRWQNQFKLFSDIPAKQSDVFDVKVTIVSNKDGFKAVAKLVEKGADNNYVCLIEQSVEKGENIFKATNCTLNEGDAANPLHFVFDFGGNPDDTKITIKDIIVQYHK